jgi:hypothetical protein
MILTNAPEHTVTEPLSSCLRWGRKLTRHWGIAGRRDEYVDFLDCGDGFMGADMPKSSNCTGNICRFVNINFTEIKLSSL